MCFHPRGGSSRSGRARVAIGKTRAGRYLWVIYVPDPQPDSVFVITAYELRGQAIIRLSKTLTQERKEMKQSKFPPGWDEQKVRRVLKHYEQQTEEEAVAEDEAAYEDSTQAIMEVPRELVPTVRELIAKHKRSRKA